MHPTGPIARRFPLVARIRPACRPLDARVGRLQQPADTASRQTDPVLASTVFNQAALLVSGVGLPDCARELCHRDGSAETAIDHCLAFEPDDGLAVFTTRLVLTALDAAGSETPESRNLLARLTSRTGESGDGYALQDLLRHEGVRQHLAPVRRAALDRALAACALGSATLPDALRSLLEEALTHARKVLETSPFDPGSPGGNPLEQRNRTAPSSVVSASTQHLNSTP
ncbi:hypothetical protein ABTY61_28590 [Kitasatospora sp. NPDC096128]|uniref:hypothetical protein n=1 Tax=Kitasatospora sp. NPDC096128 TaxID=3155547 RepID=UPI003320DBE9